MTLIHGHASNGKTTGEYRSWSNMHQRCSNPNSNRYYLYGARGVKVCKRWNSFAMFLADMGLKPSPDYSIERMNGSRDYEPDNCKWATRYEQGANKSNNRLVTINGITRHASAWGRETGLGEHEILRRLYRGKAGSDLIKPPERRAVNGEYLVCRRGLHALPEWRRIDGRGNTFCLLCKRERDRRKRQRKRELERGQIESERR
jgi:hypothetical protein